MLCCKNTDANLIKELVCWIFHIYTSNTNLVQNKICQCKLKTCCKRQHLPGVKVLSPTLVWVLVLKQSITLSNTLWLITLSPFNLSLITFSISRITVWFLKLISFMPSKLSGDIRRLPCMRQRFPPAVSKWACWSSQFQKGHQREDTFSAPSSVFSTKQPLENSVIVVHLLQQWSRFHYSSLEDKHSTSGKWENSTCHTIHAIHF